jgi:hypothetical protein
MIVYVKHFFENNEDGSPATRYDDAELAPAGLNVTGRDGNVYIVPFENILVMQNPDSLKTDDEVPEGWTEVDGT